MTSDEKEKAPKARRPRLNTKERPKSEMRGCLIPRWLAWIIKAVRLAKTTWNIRPR